MSNLNYAVICKDEKQALSVASGLSEVNDMPVKVIAFEQEEHEDNKEKEVNESEKSEEHDCENCEFQPICELLVLLDAIVGDGNE